MPGLLAPSTTPGSVVFHGVTPGLINIVLMGNPVKHINFHQNGIPTSEDLISYSALRDHEKGHLRVVILQRDRVYPLNCRTFGSYQCDDDQRTVQ